MHRVSSRRNRAVSQVAQVKKTMTCEALSRKEGVEPEESSGYRGTQIRVYYGDCAPLIFLYLASQVMHPARQMIDNST